MLVRTNPKGAARKSERSQKVEKTKKTSVMTDMASDNMAPMAPFSEGNFPFDYVSSLDC